jgi:uncharacterized protein YecT (DUF1311 family)
MLRASGIAALLVAGAVSVLAAQQALPSPCPPDTTTATLRQCMSAELQDADSSLTLYFDMAIRRSAAPSALRRAQAQWMRFREADCRALAEEHQGGGMEAVVALQCQAHLARARTHEIWSVYIRTTEDPLPEPGVQE